MWKWKILFLLLATLCWVGCATDDESGGNGDGDDDGKPPAAMVARWYYQSATINGDPTALSTVLEWLEGAEGADVQIMTNGAYAYQEVDQNGGQLWFETGWVFVDVEGGLIDVNAQLNGDGPVDETTEMTYTLDGDELTLTEVRDGNTIVFVLSTSAD